jgi:ornithine cyclodeaminase/alanine dehydrogenase
MDGTYITNARTGAAGAVSAKYTARPESSIVAMIGAGTQARWTLRALQRYFRLQEVRVADIQLEAAQKYVREMETELGVNVVRATSPDEAAKGADLIITATTADAALVHDRGVAQGATVVSIGSYQELEDMFVLSADRIFVDSWEQCMHRGELARLVSQGRLTDADICGELGEVVAGLKPGRCSSDERILVVPIGLGSLDIAIARKAFTRAMQTGAGLRFSFSA